MIGLQPHGSSQGVVDNRSNERDPRFDFVRGMCLIWIFIGHIEGSPFHALTLKRFSIMDAAEVFVFISGFVCGLVYTRKYLNAGFSGCVRKATKRGVQIWAAQVATFLGSCAVLYYFSSRGTYMMLHDGHLYTFLARPIETVAAAMALIHAPGLTGLLSLYVVMILLTPLALHALQRWPWWTMTLSFGLYLVTQFAPAVNLYLLFPSRTPWVFNPIAWQFLFVGALLLGSRKARGLRIRPDFPRWVTLGAIIGLILIAFLRCAESPKLARLIGSDALLNWLAAIPDGLRFDDKENMEPLRLFNLVLWVIVASELHRGLRIWRSVVARPLVALGSNSLIVYSAGVVLSYAAMGILDLYSDDNLMQLGVVVAGVAVMLGVATLDRRLRWPERKAAAVESSDGRTVPG